MSSSDFTFKQAEKLLEEIKIITPTIEALLSRADNLHSHNILATKLNQDLSKNIQEFNEILKKSISHELNNRLHELEKFDELESTINSNVTFLKKTAVGINATKKINCVLVTSFICGVVYFLLHNQNILN